MKDGWVVGHERTCSNPYFLCGSAAKRALKSTRSDHGRADLAQDLHCLRETLFFKVYTVESRTLQEEYLALWAAYLEYRTRVR